MSQDNPVTPAVMASTSPHSVAWSDRLHALTGISLLRKRTIERLYGASRRLADRCKCPTESRFEAPSEEPKLWCLVASHVEAGRTTSDTNCSLMRTGWLVWQPQDLGFAWCEILEVDNIHWLFSQGVAAANPLCRSWVEWESLGRGAVGFRVKTLVQGSEEKTIQQFRADLVQEILRRNPSFSHVNLTISGESHLSDDTGFEDSFAAVGLTADRLRTRMIPGWQCGDMAIRSFTAYTMTRKDTR